ncbi:homogentisate 1,2-dioxygenase [uncultured bacterium]|nr:homogentisate 1,2-dioxygenase [uncultured bacterium]
MPFYVKAGEVPSKRHTTFYSPTTQKLYREELFSTKGFSGIYTNKYHINIPAGIVRMQDFTMPADVRLDDSAVSYVHFLTDKHPSTGDFITARRTYLQNRDCVISTAHVTQQSDRLYRNSTYSELVFVHHGAGTLHTEYGDIVFGKYDYLVIPKGVIHNYEFDSLDRVKLLIIESATPFEIPKHYRNEYGQLTEDAPYYERDFRVPQFVGAVDQKGEFGIIVKARGRWYEHFLQYHPFDVVGWDGYFYPYAFNIRDFAPKVGQLHLPPPVHLVWTTRDFVVCNFVPRLMDFHPQAIAIPYYHSNIDSDEVLYYVEGDFMSRKGISEGSVTFHPMGMPHGPQPGKTEASLGVKEAHEFAVMVDTFAPLYLTSAVIQDMDPNYPQSWLE